MSRFLGMSFSNPVPNETRIAVFIDYENLALGLPKGRRRGLEMDRILKRLLEKGRIVFQRAYCDWTRYRKAADELHMLGVELVDTPASTATGKNSADIRMVVDALELSHARPQIDTFALVTGDSDFTPLVQKLKEHSRRVLGCGMRNSTSDLLVAVSDEFLYYDDLIQSRSKSRSSRRSKSKSKKADQELAFETILEVIRSLDRDHDILWSSMVKQTLGRVHPDFQVSSTGFSRFREALKEAEARGWIELDTEQARGNWVVRLPES